MFRKGQVDSSGVSLKNIQACLSAVSKVPSTDIFLGDLETCRTQTDPRHRNSPTTLLESV